MLPNEVVIFLKAIIETQELSEFYKSKARHLLDAYGPRIPAGPSEFKDYSNTTPVLEWREGPWNTRR